MIDLRIMAISNTLFNSFKDFAKFSSLTNLDIKKLSQSSSSIFDNINFKQIVKDLKIHGFHLGTNLPRYLIQEIMQFAIDTPCYANGNTNLGFYYPDKEQAQAKYESLFTSGVYYNTALHCPAIKKLESDSLLLEVAAKYLRAEPIHQGNQLSWNFPIESTFYERRQAAQVFHCNLPDRRSLKFVFYITDVGLCSSPYVCVQSSHIKKLSKQSLHKGLSFKQAVHYYGYKNIVPICGKAGFGFVQDTGCFHKETSPGSTERLVLQIEFAAKDYGIQNQNDIREASQLQCIF